MLSKVEYTSWCLRWFFVLQKCVLIFVLPKVIVGSCVLLFVSLTVKSYPQGYGGGGAGHDDDEHVDYYVSICTQ